MADDDLHSRLNRLENKIDSLSEAITTLARIDERMVSHMETARRLGSRLDSMEPRIASLELSKAKFTGWLIGIAAGSSAISAAVAKTLGG
jgi:hypothetical protein